ncbi:MAG TPA: PadR family transcriptional regulator [Gaiellaceae bacterium]|nr:PadR family transcriptional regulator [Gaiellaceae bacterium]
MSTLSPTARVILGLVRLGARTGYDIKQTIEVSTRFFWNASYGQIYPELRRLEQSGLVESERDPGSGRGRTLYRLTPAGEQTLHEWLTGPSDLFDMRDEALLKLFFGDLLTPEEVLANLRRRRESFEHVLELFRGIEAHGVDYRYPKKTLAFGIELIQWMVDWYAQAEEELLEPGTVESG